MEYADEEKPNTLIEIRQARDQAEFLRDQLTAEYQKLGDLDTSDTENPSLDIARLRQGREAMRKAIAAANRAIESIDQALRDMERVNGDWLDNHNA